MNTYRVTWTTEQVAEDHETAALQALESVTSADRVQADFCVERVLKPGYYGHPLHIVAQLPEGE